MDIEFDSNKDAINLDKHGVSLAFGRQVLDSPGRIIVPTVRIADEEERDRVPRGGVASAA